MTVEFTQGSIDSACSSIHGCNFPCRQESHSCAFQERIPCRLAGSHETAFDIQGRHTYFVLMDVLRILFNILLFTASLFAAALFVEKIYAGRWKWAARVAATSVGAFRAWGARITRTPVKAIAVPAEKNEVKRRAAPIARMPNKVPRI